MGVNFAVFKKRKLKSGAQQTRDRRDHRRPDDDTPSTDAENQEV